MLMTRGQLLRTIKVDEIKNALDAVEKRTSAEVRVSVAPFFWGDVHRAAERAFERLGMTQTQARNGVLIFVVPSRRKFSVLGDQGIHSKVGNEFWEKVAAAMSGRFRAGDFTQGLLDAIVEVGNQLSVHFPWHEGDINELPNEVDLGSKT